MRPDRQKITVAPVMVTYRALYAALWPLHMDVKADVDRLHDIWLRGAPTPDSRVQNLVGYDPRIAQPGNVEKRIVFFGLLSKWVQDVTARRGIPMTPEAAMAMLRKVAQVVGTRA